MDLYFSETGDIKLAPNRDIALTDSNWRDDAQQAYIRVMTYPGDYLLYRTLGAALSNLFGQPQSKETGDKGIKIIMEALTRDNRFATSQLSVNAVPTGPQTIRFDIYLISGSTKQMLLNIEQSLGVL